MAPRRAIKYSIAISYNQSKKIINNLNLCLIYPKISKHVGFCATYIGINLGYGSYYYESMNYFADQLSISENINYDEFIEWYVNRNKSYYISIYSKYQIDDFKATRFVSDFCGRPIKEILEIFDCVNFKNRLPMTIRTNVQIYDVVLKFFNMHLIMRLAHIFSFMNYVMKIDYVYLLRYSTRIKILNIVKREISNNKSIDYDYLSEKYPKDISCIHSESRFIGTGISKKEKIANVINSICELIKSTTQTIDLYSIRNDIDLKSIYGNISTRNVRYDCKNNFEHNFYKYDLLGCHSSSHNIGTDSCEPCIDPPDLIIPNFNMDLNMDGVIEI